MDIFPSSTCVERAPLSPLPMLHRVYPLYICPTAHLIKGLHLYLARCCSPRNFVVVFRTNKSACNAVFFSGDKVASFYVYLLRPDIRIPSWHPIQFVELLLFYPPSIVGKLVSCLVSTKSDRYSCFFILLHCQLNHHYTNNHSPVRHFLAYTHKLYFPSTFPHVCMRVLLLPLHSDIPSVFFNLVFSILYVGSLELMLPFCFAWVIDMFFCIIRSRLSVFVKFSFLAVVVIIPV